MCGLIHVPQAGKVVEIPLCLLKVLYSGSDKAAVSHTPTEDESVCTG